MRIAHTSDIQIRLLQRHKEFEEHFSNFYESLRKQKPDIITVAGDILHNKTSVSPEQYRVCADFFTSLADVAPVHMILGNHDCSLSNLSRLDSISPIVKALNNPKIFLYKNSGVFEVDDELDLVVFSCIDTDWPTINDINTNKVNVGLYHGMVKGAVLQNGQVVEDCQYTLGDFLKVVDYLQLGDIHKQQLLEVKGRAAYCGSLIQQNFGESTAKGYLVWDIEGKNKHSVDFVRLPNISPYETIEVGDDLKIRDDLDLQKGSKVRVVTRQLSSVEKKSIKDKLDALYDPAEVYFKDKSNAHMQELKVVDGAKVEDLSDVAIQNKLIKKFLKSYKFSKDEMDEILSLNVKYESQVRKYSSTPRNTQYKLGKMKWSNLLSYGEDNCFDFSEYGGLVGILGPNASGKSTVAVDALLYTLFNTNSKGVVKNDLLINEKFDYCGSSLEVEVGNDVYEIDRTTFRYLKSGKKKGNPVYQGKTDLEFRIKLANGDVINKTGEERSVTDGEIRKVFGLSEDFISTSIAPQWNLLNFIEKGSTERQKLIGRYFDLDSFEKKHKLAKERLKELKLILKRYSDKNFTKEISLLKKERTSCAKELNQAKKEKARIEGLQENLLLEINKANKDFVSLDNFTLSEEEIGKKLKKEKLFVIDEKNKVKERKAEFTKLFNDLELKSSESLQALKSKQIKEVERLKVRVDKKQQEALYLQKDIEKLRGYSCISNVDCCMLESAESKESRAKELANSLPQEESELAKAQEKLEALEGLNKLELEIKKINAAIDSSLSVIKSLNAELDSVKKHKETKERNEAIFRRLEELEKSRATTKRELEKITESVISNLAKVGSLEVNISSLESENEEYLKLKREFNCLDGYIKAVSKTGLQQVIISNNLGVINQEISRILSEGVEFDVFLESSGGKEIDILLKYPKGMPRRLELCSGMEKSLAALAIRAALISTTTLPRCNVFILDEPFGYLEDSYKESASKILEQLKSLFDSIILITHDYYFKDVVDHCVEVDKDPDGFAKIL